MSTNPPIKVVIADDQVIVAEGISVMLEQQDDFNVLGMATNGEKLLHLLNSTQPDIVLLDLNMPVMDGFETCIQIRQKFPAIVVVALTTYDDDKMRQRIKAAGAAGMLLNYTSSQELANNLRAIFAHGNDGSFTSAESGSKTEIDGQTNKDDTFLLKHKISERELDVMKLIAKGLNSEAIGKELFLSEHTIKTHRKNILDKLNLKNTAELVSFMHQHKLV